jgi:hypothetical protein
MRDVIKEVLAEWLAKFERQTKANDEYRESDPDPDLETGRFEEHDFGDLWLDRKLMGAAQFIAKVADECRDMELLGIATHVANQMQARFDEERKAIEESDRFRWEKHSEEDRQREAGLEAGRVFFGSIPASVIDMSSYRRTVEDARLFFTNPRDYLDLLSYTDERKVLKRIKTLKRSYALTCGVTTARSRRRNGCERSSIMLCATPIDAPTNTSPRGLSAPPLKV